MRLVNAVRSSKGRVVLAIDNPRYDLAFIDDVIREAQDLINVFKFGTPYIIKYGVRQLKKLIESYPDKYFIADLKLGDVGHVMAWAAEVVKEAGFSGLVAHSFVGIPGALDLLSRKVRDLGLELILQTTMTHPGSIETLDTLASKIKAIINGVDPVGLIAPANKGDFIRDLRNSFGWRYVILSPGVMSAGMTPGEGVCNGADAEVVGRYVLSSPEPLKTLEDIIKSQNEYLSRKESVCLRPRR